MDSWMKYFFNPYKMEKYQQRMMLNNIFKKKDGYHYQEFIDRQSKKGAIGGKISKRKPVPTSEATTKPWLALGISQSTYYRRKKLKNL
jgi:hypothetical protein